MTDSMANLFVDVHPSKPRLTFFLDGNCFSMASNVSVFSIRQMLQRVMADGSTWSLCIALHDCRSSRFDITSHGIWAETYPNMRWRFQVPWWNLAVRNSFAASLEHSVCQLDLNRSDLTVEFGLLLRAYYCISSTALSLQYGQSSLVNGCTCQFRHFWSC